MQGSGDISTSPMAPAIAAPVAGPIGRWLRLGLGFGLACGWIELALVLLQRALSPRISMASLRTNQHFGWMIPVGDALLFAAAGLLVGVLVRGRLVREPSGWKLLAGLAALAWLLTVDGLHPVAALALGGGLGVATGPWLGARVDRYARISRLGAGGLLAATLLMIVATTWWVATAESRARDGRPPAPSGRPNLIWLVLDNVRSASMSLYGHDRPTTPHLERIARRGIRFDEARSTASWTLPSHASMFTGRWPHELSVDFDRPLDTTHPTLAEALARQGYATAGFVGNTYYCNARYGLDRGFDRYEDFIENRAVTAFEVAQSTGLGKWLLRGLGYRIRIEEGAGTRKTAARLNADLMGWIAGRPADRPFFAFVNYYDAHAPFVTAEADTPRFGLGALGERERVEILKASMRLSTGHARATDGPADQVQARVTGVLLDSYESCLAALDARVGRLFDDLERQGLLENTAIVITSDHGEHFNERGFFGHGQSLYRREVHVPLIIVPPGALAAGRVAAEPVSLRDLAATSLDLLGLDADASLPGQSLAAHWQEAGTPGAGPILAEMGHRTNLAPVPGVPATLGSIESLVADGHVYLRNGDGREELYDLRADPDESQNLVGVEGRPVPIDHFRGLLGQVHAATTADRTPAGTRRTAASAAARPAGR